MAGTYNDIISRAGSGSDPLVPEPVSTAVIQEIPKASAALTLFQKVPLSTKTERLPVLDILPVSYFVGGDTGLEQTTFQEWKNVTLIVEEMATIVPVPVSYMADADVPIWDQVQPRMAESMGKLLDQAILWGAAKPATWGADIYSAAVASGNVIKDGYLDSAGTEAAADFGQSVTALGDLMSQTGYVLNGFAGRPGLNWRLMGMRSQQGMPIFQPNMQEGAAAQLYGYPIPMPANGSWDATKAQLLGGDFTKGIIGIRQDMTFRIFDQSVISDDNGNVILNLMQQNAVAMRLVARFAYATANPVTIMQPNDTIDGAGDTTMRWPFGVISS